MAVEVRADIQIAVDQYLDLYVEAKKMEKKMDALRKVIEPYMKEQEWESIHHTDRSGRIQLVRQERTVSNSRYTTYNIEELAGLLSPSVRKRCVVEVVDKDKLEALVKLGEVTEEILARKVTNPSISMMVKMEK